MDRVDQNVNTRKPKSVGVVVPRGSADRRIKLEFKFTRVLSGSWFADWM